MKRDSALLSWHCAQAVVLALVAFAAPVVAQEEAPTTRLVQIVTADSVAPAAIASIAVRIWAPVVESAGPERVTTAAESKSPRPVGATASRAVRPSKDSCVSISTSIAASPPHR